MEHFNPNLALRLGALVADQTVKHAEQVCWHATSKLQLANEARSTSCRAMLKVRSDERSRLLAELNCLVSGHPGSLERRRYYWRITAILGMAGLVLSHMALAPFGLGWEVWPFAVALSMVCPVAVDALLERFGTPRIIGAIALAALVVGLGGMLILAALRGDLLVLQLKAAFSIAAGSEGSITDVTQFYSSAASQLRFFFSLLALGMELVTGITLWEARRILVPAKERERIQERITTIEAEMSDLVGQIVFLQNEPEIVQQEFMLGFKTTLIQHAQGEWPRPPIRKWGGTILPLILLASLARGEGSDCIVPDLSRSTVGTEHAENIEAVARTLRSLPPGNRFHVVGVTAESFSRPTIALSGRIPLVAGPLTLLNQIDVARNRLEKQLKQRLNGIPLTAETSDVFGALFVCAEFLNQGPPTHRTITLFSDLRQSAPPINIEKLKTIPPSLVDEVKRRGLIPNLSGVEIRAYGVHSIGKDISYARGLRAFWEAYFAESGARLQTFTSMRELR